MRNKIISCVFALCATVSGVALASGGGSGGYGGGGGGSFNAPQRQIDTVYEEGKAIYRGRKAGEPSINYCIANEGEILPVKGKTIKAYKKTSYEKLANNLYNCDNPDTLVANELTRDSLLYVLYYLNKRHRLNLKGS